MEVLDRIFRLAVLGIFVPSAAFVVAFSAPSSSLQSLLTAHQSSIASLRDIATAISDNEIVAPPTDVFYLRYVVSDAYDDDEQRIAALKSNIRWRMNEGKGIVTRAHEAVAAATAGEDGTWNNEPISANAPHAALINPRLTSAQCMTTSLPATNDLVYCIRAGKIDDKELMSTVSVEQMVEFFLYSKEVNARVADLRSARADSLLKLITCNDLQGVKLIGGSKDFQSALSTASKRANDLHPSLNGRTLMLNLPTLVRPLVKIFKLFLPKAVTERLRFENGPLKNVEDLREISEGGKGREEFLEQVEVLAYG